MIPRGFTEDGCGHLICPHRSTYTCEPCARQHPEIIDVAGMYFWVEDEAERDELRAMAERNGVLRDGPVLTVRGDDHDLARAADACADTIEAEASMSLIEAAGTLRVSILYGTDDAVTEAKRSGALVAMSRLLDEFGLSTLAADVLAAREGFSDDQLPPGYDVQELGDPGEPPEHFVAVHHEFKWEGPRREEKAEAKRDCEAHAALRDASDLALDRCIMARRRFGSRRPLEDLELRTQLERMLEVW